ncbi:MAG: DUF433 domain-containing protein [Phycisphaerae bacterium]
MTVVQKSFIGIGIYSIPETSRLTGVPPRTIRRWAGGYAFRVSDAVRQSPPLWKTELPKIDGYISLGFRDLIEVRVVQALLEKNISWRRIRRIGAGVARLLKTDHPFSSVKFKTDGYRVYTELPKVPGPTGLIEPENFQLALREIITPFLSDIDYGEKGEPSRWWPMGRRDRSVVIDPGRAFGRPIINSAGIPTAVLAAAYRAEGNDAGIVARWYDITKTAVEKAVEFEEKLAA